jgi:sphingolipid C9-methyltransferase
MVKLTSRVCLCFYVSSVASKLSKLGDVLDIMEQRHDWAKMSFTWELFKYVFVEFIPSVVVHSQSQDEEQVRGHYDRKCFCLPFFVESS